MAAAHCPSDAAAPGASPTSPRPIRIHPENSKLFEFRGRPLMLLTATEHYGAVMNRPFRYDRYLTNAAAQGMTLTRLFTLFRELQGPTNPYSTCKPESTDYVAPFARVGTELARDGQPKYDLTQWNPEFFQRLHGFLQGASDRGIVVEVVLFSNSYDENIWGLNPLHHENNINAIEACPCPQTLSRRHPRLFEWQCAHVRKIVEETRQYDNVIYEICNEPAAFATAGADQPDRDEVNAWQTALIEIVRQTDHADPQHRHLIAGQEASFFGDSPESSHHPVDLAFGDLPVDVTNVHPLPQTRFAGQDYDLGLFMVGQLRLRELRRFALDTFAQPKPLNFDEDNAATQYRDPFGWTIHRKRAWTSLFCGAHYDMIDFTILPLRETGTDAGRCGLRDWFCHLSRFIHDLDLAASRPAPDWLSGDIHDAIVASVIAVDGRDYCIYLADGREAGDPEAGSALATTLRFDLPEAPYRMATFSPATGLYSPWVAWPGGADCRLDTPTFHHDLAIRVSREPAGP